MQDQFFFKVLDLKKKIKNKRFKELNKKLKILSKISQKCKISKFKLMLKGIYDPKLINTYIVGINSLNEIKEINSLNVINEKKFKCFF